MDYGALISESIDYTRDALVGRWTTWLIFVICSLPYALIQFVYDPKKIVTGSTIHWEMIPWPQLILLVLAGFLLSFLISGYVVRVYRGITPPPVFDNWGSLYLDGIRLMIVNVLWFVPVTLVFVVMLALLFLATAAAGAGSIALMLAAMLVIILVSFVLLVITILYSILGTVRYARTGSIREGIRYSAITSTIQTIGWGTYIIALLVLLVAGIIFTIVVIALSIIPFVGWVIQLVLGPLLLVFSARYITRVYDHGAPQAQVPTPATAG
jgi:hypothetical protein